jgi:integral membrane sensor domain MASE1
MTRLPVPWRLVLAVAAGYAAGSITSFVLFESSSTGAVLFLPAGVTLSAPALSDRRRWPWILAAAALVEVAVDRTQGIGPVAVWGSPWPTPPSPSSAPRCCDDSPPSSI